MAFYNLFDVTPGERDNQRYEMAQTDYGQILKGESLTVARQERVLEIAIQGLDAIENVLNFADELRATEGPAGIVARAMADEIRKALKGQR